MKPRNDRIKLNTKHWLARGLQYWYPSPEGTGVWHGYSLSRRKSLPLVSGSSPMVPTIHGNNAIDFSSGSSIFTETDYTGFYEKTALTIGFWFKTGTAKADNVGLTLQGGGSGASLLCYTVESTGPRIYWAGTIIDPVVSGLDDNDWHHYVFTTYSSTNNNASMDRHELYIDGVSVGSDTTVKSTGPGGYFEVGLEVGHYNNGAQTFNGQLKDITIHDIALTSEQVWDWYTNERWSLYAEKPRFALADPLPQTRSLTVPQVWTKQPPVGMPIDDSAPITRDLGYVYDWRNFPYRNTRKYGPVLYLEQGAAQIKHGAIDRVGNRGVQFTHVDNYIANPASEDHKFLGFVHSVFLQFDYTNYSAGNYVFCNHGTTATSWHLGHSSAGNFRYTYSGRADYNFTATTVSAGLWRVIYTSSGSFGTARVYAKNLTTGAYYTDSVALGSPFDPSQDRLILGWDGGGSTAPGIHSLFAEWGRELSASEAEAIIENPYQIFKRDPMQVPIEYEELTFDADAPEGLYFIPQKWTEQPK